MNQFIHYREPPDTFDSPWHFFIALGIAIIGATIFILIIFPMIKLKELLTRNPKPEQ